jgi:hypothetical protein
MNKSKGVIYISINKKWVKEAVFSARSIKKVCPKLPITLFTDKKFKSDYIDNFIVSSSLKGTRFKFDYLDKTPYDYTLYLDSDTMVVSDIISIFDILDKFDIITTHCICRISKEDRDIFSDYRNIPDSFCQFQGGVMFYRKTEKVINFVRLWKTLYNKYKKEYNLTQDQISLRVALWNSDLRIYMLPLEYNLKDYDRLNKFYKKIQPKIIHDHKLYSRSKKYISKNFKLI